MKDVRKCCLIWFIVLAILGAMIQQAMPFASAETVSGSCGDNLTWEFNSEAGVLTITGSGEMQNWFADTLVPWSACRDAITSISLPQGLTSIGDYAFRSCFRLTSAEIPVGVVSIGNYAFSNCSNLESINLPNSVTQIGNHAFWCCSSLTSANIPDALSRISSYLFAGCTGLNSVSISESVTGIDGNAFANCSNLVTITIPNSVISIGNYAFLDCTRLSDLTFGNSVANIGASAFSNCVSLPEITVPNSVTEIGSSAFSGCKSLTSVTLPESISVIRGDVFRGCINLTEITIPNSVTCIGSGAFSKCSSLTGIQIPSSVQSIEYYAFADCASLMDVTISYAVQRIDYRAFYNCNNLAEITIPSSVTSIGENAFGFYGEYRSYDEDYKTDEFTVSGYPNTAAMRYAEKYGLSFVAVEETRTGTCGDSLFWSFNTGTGILTISGSGQMTNWLWPDDVPWYDCRDQITAVELPDELESIGSNAFYGCSALSSLNIPRSVTSIGWTAFYDCTCLTKLIVAETNPSFSNDEAGVLFDKNKTTVICCPCAFSGRYEIPNTVTTIGAYAFSPCPGLTDVRISDSVKEIGDYAFYRCQSLTSVTIPNSVMRIEDGAFGVLWDDENLVEHLADEFIIYGYSFSAAQTFAENTGIPFVALDVDANPFSDVADGAYYTDAVLWAVQRGITSGTGTTTFSPNASCTRAQVVTFLWRAKGQPEPTKTDNPFIDVKDGAYYYKAVLWAVENGVTAGTGADTFSPNASCTRAQVVTFLWRAAGQPKPGNTNNPFTDVKDTAYYIKAVLWAVEKGITTGTGAGKFSPNKTCTRGQVVTFLHRDLAK